MNRNLQHFLALSACAFVLHTALADESVASAAPLARLTNGEVVSEQDMSSYLDRRMDLRQQARNAWGVEKVVEEMALTRVLSLEGQRIGVQRKALSDGEQSSRFDDVYALSVHRQLSPSCAQPAGEEEARQYFYAHPAAFKLPVQARVERIILPAAEQLGGEPAMAWLQAQVREVIQGKRKFGVVAQRAQLAYNGDVQGDLGWIGLEGDNTIMRALQTVKPGELLGPVQDGEFVYLFSVVQRRDARQLSWDEAKSFAATRAVTWCRQEASDKLRADLFQRYGVNIDREAIRALFAKQGGQK